LKNFPVMFGQLAIEPLVQSLLRAKGKILKL